MKTKPKKRKTQTILTEAAAAADTVLVLGYTKDGKLYCDTNILDGGDVLWLLEQVKHRMLWHAPAEFV